MDKVQQAILTHLKSGKNDNYPSAKTIDAYAGELLDVHKLTNVPPGILVVAMDETPVAEEPLYEADLIIVTDSQSFNKSENRRNNMQLAEQVVNYLAANYLWYYDDLPWQIDPETVRVRLGALLERFAIVFVSLQIKNLED